ncbi:MAG: hypothetical protein ACYSU4_11305 [Planctomycetota bacterium]|jgi:hypothetical protein
MKKLSFQLLLLFSFIPNQIWAQPQKLITPSFPKVDKEPLSTVPVDSKVLYEDWLMKESAIIGNDGHKISLPGYFIRFCSSQISPSEVSFYTKTSI